VETGPGADAALLGRRVIGVPQMPHGGLAESCILEADYVAVVPDGVPSEPAAAALISYSSAHLALHRRAALRPGETLLVHGGAGGIGAAAIQLGVAAGARVLATAGSPEKVEACLAQGAEAALDHTAGDFVEWTLEFTGGLGADVILDPIGGDVFDGSRRCVAVEGRIVVAGFAGGRVPDLRASHLLFRNYSVLGLFVGAYRRGANDHALLKRVHDEVFELVGSGRVIPRIDRVVPLAEAPAALADLENRLVSGKALVQTRL
jgi:NADPH2:quinone reductase